MVTPENLLSHSAHLPAWYPFYTETDDFWKVLEKLLARGDSVPNVLYSDIGFMLLGILAQKVSGCTLPQLLAQLNGLLDTEFTYTPEDVSVCIPTEFGNQVEMRMCAERGISYAGWRSTQTQIKGSVNDGNAFYYWGGRAGHAGVFGTAEDLLHLAQLYLQDGEYQGKQLIPAELVQYSFLDRGGRRGLMWDLSDTFPCGVGHTGFTGTALWLCPKKKIAAALLASRLPMPGPPNLTNWRKECFQTIYQSIS